jgi:hypothetical protein
MLSMITDTLVQYGYRFRDEKQLHQGMMKVMDRAGIEYEHEYTAGSDRFDFFCDGIVIEAKIKGSLADALRQAERYCQNPLVKAVLIVSTKATHALSGICHFNEKPVQILKLSPQAF